MNFFNLVSCLRLIERPLIVAIQGMSSSANYSFVDYLEDSLKHYKINVMRIKTHSYYKSIERIPGYDFNNPAAINWDFLRNTLNGIKNRHELLPCYQFGTCNNNSSGYLYQNSFPVFIIL